MFLYNKIHNLIKSLDKTALLTGLPVTHTISFNATYLGGMDSTISVQFKTGKKEMGWLYSKAAVVVFQHNGVLYEVLLSALKEYVEEVFKDKKFSDTPAVGKLTKDKATGAISGLVETKEVIKISHVIQEG